MQQFSQLRPLLLSPATRPLVLVMVVPLAATCLLASTLSAAQVQARMDAAQAEVRGVTPERQRRAEEPAGAETPLHDPPVRVVRGGESTDSYYAAPYAASGEVPDARFAAPGAAHTLHDFESLEESLITNRGGLRGPPALVTS